MVPLEVAEKSEDKVGLIKRLYMKLYDHPLSGNCYKARLLLSHLGVEYEKIRVELFEGEHKSDSFTKLNPNQKIPVLIDGDYTIWESNAVVLYIAKK